MRLAGIFAGLVALTACAPTVPDSGAAAGAGQIAGPAAGQRGVGFDTYSDYTTYRAQRDAELVGAAGPMQSSTLAPIATPDPTETTAAAATAAATSQPRPATPLAQASSGQASSGQGDGAAQVDINHPGISDEQDFAAVSTRQTIESDAERLRRQREAYKVIEPTAVPQRPVQSGPNIVAFAVSTRNPVGEKIYRRGPSLGSRYERNCAKFASADLAQEAFLRAGGPQRDKLGIDPDGDGFACDWDPTPFRRISASNG